MPSGPTVVTNSSFYGDKLMISDDVEKSNASY